MGAERELVRSFSPIRFQGGELKLERPQETPNRFFRSLDWLVQVAFTDYPPEHWDEEHIQRSFTGFCNIAEIDPGCLTTFDCSPLQLVLGVCHRLEVHSELWVDAEDLVLGGSVVSIMSVRVWPRANQLDEDGGYIPIFRHPAPSPAPGPLGPHGSFLPHSPGGPLHFAPRLWGAVRRATALRRPPGGPSAPRRAARPLQTHRPPAGAARGYHLWGRLRGAVGAANPTRTSVFPNFHRRPSGPALPPRRGRRPAAIGPCAPSARARASQ
jgi:hypothetical protein